jgi:hypothetical protein
MLPDLAANTSHTLRDLLPAVGEPSTCQQKTDAEIDRFLKACWSELMLSRRMGAVLVPGRFRAVGVPQLHEATAWLGATGCAVECYACADGRT